MKPLYFLFVSLMLFGCAETTLDETEIRLLSGRWDLESVQGGLQGLDLEYEPDETVLNLNLFNNTLSLSSKLTENDPRRAYHPFESGNYSFELQEQEGNFLYTYDLILEGEPVGTIALRLGKLQVDTGLAADGFVFIFGR